MLKVLNWKKQVEKTQKSAEAGCLKLKFSQLSIFYNVAWETFLFKRWFNKVILKLLIFCMQLNMQLITNCKVYLLININNYMNIN